MNVRRRGFWLLILPLLISFALASDWNQPVKLSQRATDLTHTLSQSELSALEAKLKDFEQATSTQIVVVMVPSTGDTPIEEAALGIAETNGIGRKGKNNGVLLFIAKNDRHLRIEVGYGLEGALPDVLAGQIIRKEITPLFRDGRFYAGIDQGVNAIIAATRGEYKADTHQPNSLRGLPFFLMIFVFFILFGVFRRRHRSFWGGGPPFYTSGLGGFPRSGGGGWSSGGGFSGGGGSFGGGGASGSW